MYCKKNEKDMKKDKLIAVVCYDQIEYWHSRAKAKKFFRECALACEGCEKERYVNVYFSLDDGEDIAADGASWPYDYCKLKGWVVKTNAPDGTRDYGGKIWYPED